LVHVSGMFGNARHNLALIAPVAWHPRNNSEVICADLGQAPDFLEQDTETLRQHLFTPRDELPEGIQRPPLKTIRLNRAPVLLPASWVAGDVAARLGLDGDLHRQHLAALRAARATDPKAFTERLQAIWQEREFAERTDPDVMLYEGFIGNDDRSLCEQVATADPAVLARQTFPFGDPRLPELLFRYRARNYPDTLSVEETAQWREHCQQQWQEGSFTLTQFEQEMAEERARPEATEKTLAALDALDRWVQTLSAQG